MPASSLTPTTNAPTPAAIPSGLDLTNRLGEGERTDASLSELARGAVGSEILKIAAEIRALRAAGASVCNLTVGDFEPALFPIPPSLLEGVRKALADGHTNYPPSDGVLALREAVVRYYQRELGLRYPVDSVLIAGGARPLLYGAYRTLLDPGDVALYPVPSWNNNHYAYLAAARGVPLPVHADSNFFPTVEQLRPHLGGARLLLLNSPLNPTGTVIDPAALAAIARAVVEENARRAAAGRKSLWLVYDQVYWQLTHGSVRHTTPVALVPEVAPYTVMLDAASKSFAATGLRVGWAVMPPAVRRKMADILGHVGAWAPKAEQVAVAALLDDPVTIRAHHERMIGGVRERLAVLAEGFAAMRRDGYPVDALAPQGAIYLSARVSLPGRKNEDVRKWLLQQAGFAAVPFQAFGLYEETGWFRLSVGAVSLDDLRAIFPRLRAVLPRA
ncbi:MAG: aminotransferase class I/II-fold pyridoxal phosphate-dependent enzyme [Planctomycetes bacterium]|nr:aminotransferase class I/II-fold pyridoxal phosphate-dependent enzyme [Planctomycetota bacterium]